MTLKQGRGCDSRMHGSRLAALNREHASSIEQVLMTSHACRQQRVVQGLVFSQLTLPTAASDNFDPTRQVSRPN